MAKKELPPMGMPLKERSSAGYFFGIAVTVLVCGAATVAAVYGWLEVTTGPCDDRYAQILGDLDADVNFFRSSGDELGLSSVAIQDLRTSAQLAGEALVACCEQRGPGAHGACDVHADAIAAQQARLAATRNDAYAAKNAIRTAAADLRGLSIDLTELAESAPPAAPGSVAAPPPAR